MSKTVEAIYEGGTLCPLSLIKGLKKHQRVVITVEKPLKKTHPLAGPCGILPDEDAKEMLSAIEEEFEKDKDFRDKRNDSNYLCKNPSWS